MNDIESPSHKESSMVSHLLGELTKDQTELIKAFALFLMIFGHVLLANLPGYSLVIFGKDIKPYLYEISGICVPLFAFISGYGLCLSYSKEKDLGTTYRSTFKRILKFWLAYCLIFLCVFFPFVLASGSFTWEQFGITFTGWSGYVPYS